jgi:hypothetical protein
VDPGGSVGRLGGVVPVIRVVISGLVWGRIRVSRVCGGDAPALEWFLMVS